MRIVLRVGKNINEVGQRSGIKVRGKLRKWDHVCGLRRRSGNVAQISKWVVALQVSASIWPGVSNGGNAFDVCLPCFSRAGECANNVVIRDGAGKTVVKGFKISGGQHEVIRDGRMRIGKIICRQTVRRGQSVQIRHRRIANNLPETVIFQHYQKNVVCRCRGWGRLGCDCLEETPPHPAQISVAAKNKDVKNIFMIGPLEPMRAGAFAGLDASALAGAAPG